MQILSRLSIQAALHGRGPAHQDARHTSALRDSTFATFNNVQQARDALNSLLVRSLGPDDQVGAHEGPATIAISGAKQETSVRCLQQWASRLDHLLAGPLQNASSRELRPFHALCIINIIAIILSSTTDSGVETSFDEHLLQFTRIISLGQSMVDANSSFSAPSSESFSTATPVLRPSFSTSSYVAKANPWADSFTFDMGIIPAIYMTAIKCRCPHLRRQALDLLSLVRPRREGLWDALLLQKVARRVIDFEESHCLEPVDPMNSITWPLEQHRIHGVILLPTAMADGGMQHVRFTWRPNGPSGQWEDWEEQL